MKKPMSALQLVWLILSIIGTIFAVVFLIASIISDTPVIALNVAALVMIGAANVINLIIIFKNKKSL